MSALISFIGWGVVLFLVGVIVMVYVRSTMAEHLDKHHAGGEDDL